MPEVSIICEESIVQKAGGLANYNAANLQYGTLAALIAHELNYQPSLRPDGTPNWWETLSTGREASADTLDGHFEWIMRPELAEALLEMRWARQAS